MKTKFCSDIQRITDYQLSEDMRDVAVLVRTKVRVTLTSHLSQSVDRSLSSHFVLLNK